MGGRSGEEGLLDWILPPLWAPLRVSLPVVKPTHPGPRAHTQRSFYNVKLLPPSSLSPTPVSPLSK